MIRACQMVLFFVVAAILTTPTPTAASEGAAATLPDSGVVVFYFHGHARCVSCRYMEAYTEEAVVGGFGEQLASGEVSYRAVNVQDPTHKHFIHDFKLTNKGVVIAELVNGEATRYTNLAMVWRLLRNKEAFISYVQEETLAFLGD